MPAWGAPAPTQQSVAAAPQPAAVSLIATDSNTTTQAPEANLGAKYWPLNGTAPGAQDWATFDWAAQYGGATAAAGGKKGAASTSSYSAPAEKTVYGPGAISAGSSSYGAGNGAAVSLVAVRGTPRAAPIDPVLAAKIA